MQQLNEKDLEEKVALLTSIEQYRIWPQQTLQKLAQALEWVRYPPASSTILEIYNRPFFCWLFRSLAPQVLCYTVLRLSCVLCSAHHRGHSGAVRGVREEWHVPRLPNGGCAH